MSKTEFTICVAEHHIQISSCFAFAKEFCKGYLINEETDLSAKPQLFINICTEDIEFERVKSENEDRHAGITIRNFSDEYLETLAIYRKIATGLLAHQILLFHGSAIAVDGKGYLFTAKSGTGKSTHTKLWRDNFGNRAVMINDDKPLLHITDQGVIVYGTPWDGKHRLSTNTSVPLMGICILNRASKNEIKKSKKNEVYSMLLQQTNRPQNASDMKKTLELIDMLADKVGLYTLGCNMETEAALVAFEGMQK